MITASDIIVNLIKQKGYTSIFDFAKKTGVCYSQLANLVATNTWTKCNLEMIGEKLGEDLKFLANLERGKERGVKFQIE